MTSAGDNCLLESSLEAQYDDSIFTSKSVFPLPDSQSGNYAGSIVFDGQQISSSGMWQDLSDVRLDIPYIVQGTSTTLEGINAQTITLKNGLDIIDSIQIEAGGKTLCSASAYSNHLYDFQKVTSTTKDYDEKFGLAEYYAKNNSRAFVWNAAASLDGDGICNNRLYGVTDQYSETNDVYGEPCNEGARKRSSLMYNTITGNNGLGTTYALSATECAELSKSNFRLAAGTNDTDGAVYVWDFLVCLKLKNLTNVFEKIGLCKGMPFRIRINYNAASWTVTQVGSTTAITSIVQSNPTITHGTCNPVLVNSATGATTTGGVNPNTFLYCTIGTGGTIAFVSNVYKTSSYTSSLAIGGCIMQVPSYSLKPEIEKQLVAAPKKRIRYLDFVTNQLVASCAAGITVNFTVTNSLPNMKYLVVIPHITAGATAANTGMVSNTKSPFTSCFDTSPNTTAPFAALTNVQVMIGNVGLFSIQKRYDCEVFFDEVSKINAMNGGNCELTSGLLNYADWDALYRYYAFDLSRATTDKMAKSLVFTAKNSSKRALDLYFYVVYEKEAEVDRVSGLITEL